MQLSNAFVKYFVALTLAVLCVFVQAGFVSHRNCNGVPKGTIMPNPGNCSQYIECNGLRSTLGECPEGTYFNAEVLSCDSKASVCQGNGK